MLVAQRHANKKIDDKNIKKIAVRENKRHNIDRSDTKKKKKKKKGDESLWTIETRKNIFYSDSNSMEQMHTNISCGLNQLKRS